MATNTLFFTGKCQWAKVKNADTKFNPEGEYKIDVFLDKDNLKKFVDSKLQLKLRHADGTDEPYVTFKRPEKQMIKGDIVVRGRPILLDNDNNTLDAEKVEIGNGSTVTVKVTTYDGAKGKGHRLEAVRIDELIPYGVDADVPQEGLPF